MIDARPNRLAAPCFPRSVLYRSAAAACLAVGLAQANAQSAISDASRLSAVPVGASVAATGAVLSAGATLVVVSVVASGDGAVWLLERASTGARTSVRVGLQAVGGASVAAGTLVTVTAVSTGWVLSAASEAVAFVPNEIGSALLYDERVTR
ncbi:hypothetical protein [Piscinibacter koreensis]|uniref:Uncharacterized protein n=1 Tax=Piscinibacter koreensis TaxID=2742824 RepID=A0A7Y6TUS4_9BURK|nr:hypothetical protein [Schlegelella koreensis]NUZ04310.1 hypothetical protein [Schlegelella koreensis]